MNCGNCGFDTMLSEEDCVENVMFAKEDCFFNTIFLDLFCKFTNCFLLNKGSLSDVFFYLLKNQVKKARPFLQNKNISQNLGIASIF